MKKIKDIWGISSNRRSVILLLTAITFFLCLFAAGSEAAEPAILSAGSGSGNRSTTVTIPVNFTPSPDQGVSAISFRIQYSSADLAFKEGKAGPAALNASKGVTINGNESGVVRFVVFGLNDFLILDGVLAEVTFDILSSSSIGNTALTLTNYSASSPDAVSVPLSIENGIITISDIVTNHAPELSPIGNQSVEENRTLSFVVSASDPDGDTVTISASGLESWMSFDGSIFSANPGYGESGNYNVTFTASDGSLQDSETMLITVENVNRVPSLASIGNKSVDEGNELSFVVSASDPDGDTVTITASPLESWMSFDGSMFSANPGYGESGNYNVTFTASDGSLQDSEVISIAVGEVNQAPELALIGNKSVEEGNELSFVVSASDPDGDTVIITASPLESWMSFDGSMFSANPGYGESGNYNVTFTASDGSLQDSEVISIAVGEVNQAPELALIGNKSVDEGNELSFAVSAIDPDGDTVTITAEGLNGWMSFDGSTFTANPGYGDSGNYEV
ncbi:MAG: putative Ig domain-containing protein, partial [Candidatus Omnitrophota bacterium]